MQSTLTHALRTALTSPLQPSDALSEIPAALRDQLPQDPVQVIRTAYAQLYAAPFHQVPTKWRRLYEEARLWSALLILEAQISRFETENENGNGNIPCGQQWEDQVIEHCDMAIIMTGAPARRNLIDALLDSLTEPESSLRSISAQSSSAKEGGSHGFSERKDRSTPPLKRRRHDTDALVPHHLLNVPLIFPTSGSAGVSALPIISHPVPEHTAPSLQAWTTHISSADPQPLVIKSALHHWTALTRWRNPRYLLHRTHAGRRRVPVEFGKSYVDEGWGQGIIPFGEFLRKELIGRRSEIDIEVCSDDGLGGEEGMELKDTNEDMELENSKEIESQGDSENDQTTDYASIAQRGRRKGYLAQHDLLSQIPALRKDIAIPDYCYCQRRTFPRHTSSKKQHIHKVTNSAINDENAPSSLEDDHTNGGDNFDNDHDTNDDDDKSTQNPLLNIWLGPPGTISPAHTDPHDNLYAQVLGAKYIRLYPPDQSARLYPMGTAYHHIPQREPHTTDTTIHESVAAHKSKNVKQDKADEHRAANQNRQDGDAADVAADPSQAKSYSMSNTSSLNISLEITWQDELSATGTLTPKGLDRKRQREEQRTQRPGLAEATFLECIVQPGELLYIPQGWWHYVQSLEVSASVSFWW